MRLWLVRHARPLIDSGLCYGASNVPADQADTLACARALAAVLPQGVCVRTSPLQRCEQLALCLQELRPDLMPVGDARLTEMDFGCWEGQRWDAIAQSAFDKWTAQFGTWRFGGRESVNEVLKRIAAVLAETAQQTDEAVWITHAGVIRGLSLLAQGITHIERADQWPVEVPGFGQWQQMQLG